ncbi:MAG: GC-type dockerin domain-anchored protein [Phycisphaerales bacterium JB039]
MLRTLSALACAGVASVAAGQETLRFDLPQGPLAIFGAQWAADFLESGEPGALVRTRLVVRFRTDSPAGSFHDAADILFQFQLPTDGVPTWSVRGSDLGWSGTGEFAAEIDTDAFAGPLLEVPPGSHRLWYARIISDDPAHQRLGGELTGSFFEATVILECPADLTRDRVLDFYDFIAFQNLFAAGDLRADFTGDGVLDVFDFLEFFNQFAAGCP